MNSAEYEKRIQFLLKYEKDPSTLIKDLTELTNLTTADLDKCIAISNANLGDQSWQRLVVRTAFSIIDSVCYKLKELIYCTANVCHIDLSVHEKELLLEFKKDKQGNFRRCYPGFADNVKFTLNTASKFFGLNPIVLNDNNWMAFLESIEIRDRITHPKHPRDLAISPQEYDKVADAFYWFIKRIFEATVASSGVAKVKWKKIEAGGRVAPSA